MGDINTSTLKRFLKPTGLRAKPAAIETFGDKICAYANKLAEAAAVKATADKRKTLFPEDFTMAEENETTAPEETVETAETEETAEAESTESTESEESEDEN